MNNAIIQKPIDALNAGALRAICRWVFFCLITLLCIFVVWENVTYHIYDILSNPIYSQHNKIVYSALAEIESHNNPLAVSSRKAIGIFQITRPCLSDVNAYLNTNYSLLDCFNPRINYTVAYTYISFVLPKYFLHYNIPLTTTNILWAYNAGIGRIVRGEMPAETKKYIERYYECLQTMSEKK